MLLVLRTLRDLICVKVEVVEVAVFVVMAVVVKE